MVLKSVPLHWHKTRGRLKTVFQTALYIAPSR
nr:MAG TPA: hypothetical protein [Inoviridae sp.]